MKVILLITFFFAVFYFRTPPTPKPTLVVTYRNGFIVDGDIEELDEIQQRLTKHGYEFKRYRAQIMVESKFNRTQDSLNIVGNE